MRVQFERERSRSAVAHFEGIAILNLTFLGSMSLLEASAREEEWREVLAGFLVLRLYRFWQLEPRIALRDNPGVVALRRLVDGLSHTSPARHRLRLVLDELSGEPGKRSALLLRRRLTAYATVLATEGRESLATDVRRACRGPQRKRGRVRPLSPM